MNVQEQGLVHVKAGSVTLAGDLLVPQNAKGVVLFAHGSGSSRFSSRNRAVAHDLRRAGFGTLLLDLLTTAEEARDAQTAEYRFDIEMLARRLVGAMEWLGEQSETGSLPVGMFGASTGGGAAIVAAAERPGAVRAIVSRGGRPDLAGDALPMVQAPTLLIVGGLDGPVIEMNESARARMRCPVELKIISGATHLFEEPGKLEEVSRLAAEWFSRYLD